jgi:hypothetical protein
MIGPTRQGASLERRRVYPTRSGVPVSPSTLSVGPMIGIELIPRADGSFLVPFPWFLQSTNIYAQSLNAECFFLKKKNPNLSVCLIFGILPSAIDSRC